MLRPRLFLRSVFHRTQVDEELDEELQYHFESLVDQGIQRGLTREEARTAAARAMGPVTQNREKCREARGVDFLDDLWRDLRYAGRSMRRNPGFAALAILIMALGIGANTAVFSVVNAVLLRPLAYHNPERIVSLGTREIAQGPSDFQQVSIPNFQDWQSQSSSFEAMAVYGSREAPVVAHGAAAYAMATEVSAEFFRAFAVAPVAGRAFVGDELKQGSDPAALIGYAYWQNHFGGDAGTVTQTLRVYGRLYRIVGVLPPGFGFPDKTDIWVTALMSADDLKQRTAQNWRAVGRLKPGVSLKQAQAEMDAIAGRLAAQYPQSNAGRTVAVIPVMDRMVGNVRLTLYLLLGAVGLVLLIACANTAMLLLGKAMMRTREITLRGALGAGRGRIIRQLVTESLLLAVIAGTAGLAIASGGARALIALAPPDLPRLDEIGTDRWVLVFTLGISVVTSLVFGLLPAIHASKIDLNEALKQSGAKSTTSGGVTRMRGLLAVTEFALTVVLLSGAGLLMKSFVALQNVELGFRPENVLVMRATVPVRPQAPEATRYYRAILPKVARLPGVVAAGATMAPPGHVDSSGAYFVDRMPAQFDIRSAPQTVLSVVAADTFRALGIPVKAGRDFNDGDAEGRPRVAVVNETLVRRAFGKQDPLGRKIVCTYDNFEPMTIVGVVGDVRQNGPAAAPVAECYMPYLQHGFNGNALSIVARTVNNPESFEQTLRRLARETSPDVPVTFTTMQANLADTVAAPRFRTVLFGVFAGLAVCLAMAGIYGVMACAVGQRTSEIGVRMALGAGSGSVVRLILAQGLTLAGIGLVIGVIAALAGARLLTTMLFQIKPGDPFVYMVVAALAGAVATGASFVPAWRASRIDPLTAIRHE
jgi:putative ABC transport system permease protein